MRQLSSLSARLLTGVLATVAATWLGVAASGYFSARHELEELFDAHLTQAAALLAAQIGDDIDDLEIEHAPLLHRYVRRVAFQIWEDGQLRLHSQSAPSRRLSEVTDGFSDSRIDGIRWRVFSVWTDDGGVLVQVAELTDMREEVSRRMLGHFLVPLAIGLPLMGLVLAFTIRTSLRPLARIADAVAATDPRHPRRLPLAGAPREIAPLVSRLNDQFTRIAELIEHERRFTSDAAHELRTPIAAIRAHAELARDAATPERQHAIEQVLAGCERAARLVDQLLTLARLDSGAEVPFADCELGAIAREELATLAQAAHSKGVTLDLEAPVPVMVRGVAPLLGILARNLVDNAIRYSPRGTPVRVITRATAEGPCLMVEDCGPGIEPAERTRVLDRFYRVLGTGEQGTGLGLSIASRIATLHGAELVLEENPGGGLRASARFPQPDTPLHEPTRICG